MVPPGSPVSIALLAAGAAGTTPNDDVLRLEFAPPMFTFADPDDNLLVLIEAPLDPGKPDHLI